MIGVRGLNGDHAIVITPSGREQVKDRENVHRQNRIVAVSLAKGLQRSTRNAISCVVKPLMGVGIRGTNGVTARATLMGQHQ